MDNNEIALNIAAMTQLKSLPQWGCLVELIQKLDIDLLTEQILNGEVASMEELRLKKENLRLLKTFISFPDEYRKRLISMNTEITQKNGDPYHTSAKSIEDAERAEREGKI